MNKMMNVGGKLALLPKEAFMEMHPWTRISFSCSVFLLSAFGNTLAIQFF